MESMKQNFINNYDVIIDKINKQLVDNGEDKYIINTVLYRMSTVIDYKTLKEKITKLKLII
jgi:hypothetical protein